MTQAALCKSCDILAGKLKHIEGFIDIISLVNSSLEISEIKKKAIESAMRLTDAEAGSLLFVDDETEELYFDVARGEKGDKVKVIRLERGQGLAGWVAEHQLPLIVDDVSNDPRFYRKVDELSGFRTKNMICVPVTIKTNLIGVLQIINKRHGVFNADDLQLMVGFSNQIAIAVENVRLHEELKETFYETVQAFAETIEMRDPYTGGHTRRVMEYALAIGKWTGLKRETMVNLRLASILHDIGKIGVNDKVLLKPDKLSPEEMEHMKQHSNFGAEVLSSIKKLKAVVPGVRYHHERYDGLGYPEGLKEREIPRLARIISVADAFDAMTTERSYRKKIPHDAALQELQKHAGTQFDPEIINIFFNVYKTMQGSSGR